MKESVCYSMIGVLNVSTMNRNKSNGSNRNSSTTLIMNAVTQTLIGAKPTGEASVTYTSTPNIFLCIFCGDNSTPGSPHTCNSGNGGLIVLNTGTNMSGLAEMTAINGRESVIDDDGQHQYGHHDDYHHDQHHNHSCNGMYLSNLTHKYAERIELPSQIYDIIFEYLNWFNIYKNESILKVFRLRLFTHENNGIIGMAQCRRLIYGLYVCMNFQITFYDHISVFGRNVEKHLFVLRLELQLMLIMMIHL